MTGRRTFASDDEREAYELDAISSAETRLTALEGGGGGGGMVETCWAAFATYETIGPGSGSTGWSTAWTLVDSAGTDPPEVDGGDPAFVVPQADGFYVLTANVGADTAAMTEGTTVVLGVSDTGGGGTYGSLYLPLSHGAEVAGRARLTRVLHLAPGDHVEVVSVLNDSWAGSYEVGVQIYLSRIGTRLGAVFEGL